MKPKQKCLKPAFFVMTSRWQFFLVIEISGYMDDLSKHFDEMERAVQLIVCGSVNTVNFLLEN